MQKKTPEIIPLSSEGSQSLNIEDEALQFSDVVEYKSKHPNNILYTEAAQKVYETFEEGVRKYIKSIIVEPLIDSGGLKSHFVNGNIEIFIYINSFMQGEWILENYNNKNRNLFTDTLAHEMVHAKNIVHIISHYGNLEYELIRKDRIALLAWYSLDEYIACKEVAKQYKSFDLKGETDSIEKIIEIPARKLIDHIFFSNESNQKSKESNFIYLQSMFYDIATRSAFADESIDYIKLISTKNKIYELFITKSRELFRQNYFATPLNKEKYYLLGIVLLTEYVSTITNLKISDIEKKIHDLI